MKIIFAVFAMLGSLTACVSSEQAREAYRQKLSVWFGASERELVAYWGPPTSVYEVDGDRYLTYFSSKLDTLPGPHGRYLVNMPCQLTFSIEQGAVAAWRFQGGGCY